MAEARLQASEARRKNLESVLKQVRENRYAMSEGRRFPARSQCARLPAVRSEPLVAQAAINITGPATRRTRSEMLTHLEALNEEIAHVSEQLGYRE